MRPGFIAPVFSALASHVYRLCSSPAYRTWCWLGARFSGLSRFTPCRARIGNWRIEAPDAASLLSTFGELFVERIYAFRSASPAPRILDIGANIGLSVLFFKSLYPAAKITAYEADPAIFGYLERNLRGNGYADVTLVNQAIWHEDARLRFFSEGADGGRVVLPKDTANAEVEAVDVRRILRETAYDLVKIDIEGAEASVVPAMAGLLGQVKFIFVEYHSPVVERQSLARIIDVLAESGFRLHIQSVGHERSPFMPSHRNRNFDMQLNIFGWREP